MGSSTVNEIRYLFLVPSLLCVDMMLRANRISDDFISGVGYFVLYFDKF